MKTIAPTLVSESDFELVRELFDQAVKLSLERRHKLLAASEHEAHVVELVRDLLEVSTDKSDIEIGQPFQQALSALEIQILETQIDRYSILSKLNEGGMGSVFLAKRSDNQFQKQVVVKLVRLEKVDANTIEQFKQERQILADLEHPNIARLLDGGTTIQGIPYVVMEYVDGVPVTDYIRNRNPSIYERLKLFCGICSAVQFAHQHLFIHRDIKPSNILVTDAGIPKLLDFGIASITKPGSDKSLSNTVNALTIDYASPEQILGESVSTSSDIYSLGLLLYELLLDTPLCPFNNAEELKSELSDCINADNQLRPEIREQVAKQLPKRYSKDLGHIIEKAVAWKPAARYLQVDGLIGDIRSVIAGEPISILSHSKRYRISKFIRRHRYGVTYATFAVLAIVSLAVLATSFAYHASRERDIAQGVKQFMLDAFRAADPTHSLGDKVTAKDILDRSADSVKNQSLADNRIQFELLNTLTQSYVHLGLYQDASSLADYTQKLLDEYFINAPIDAAKLDKVRAQSQLEIGNNERAVAELLTASINDLNEQGLGNSPVRWQMEVLRNKAEHRYLANERESFQRLHALLPEIDRYADVFVRTNARIRLAIQLRYLKPTDSRPSPLSNAEQLLLQAQELSSGSGSNASVLITDILNELGHTYLAMENYDQAMEVLLRLISLSEAIYGEYHPVTAEAYHVYGRGLKKTGEYQAALESFNKAIHIDGNQLGEDHINIAFHLANLSSVYSAMEEYSTAVTHISKARDISFAYYPNPHFIQVTFSMILGNRLTKAENYPAALSAYERALQIAGTVDPPYTTENIEYLESLVQAAKDKLAVTVTD